MTSNSNQWKRFYNPDDKKWYVDTDGYLTNPIIMNTKPHILNNHLIIHENGITYIARNKDELHKRSFSIPGKLKTISCSDLHDADNNTMGTIYTYKNNNERFITYDLSKPFKVIINVDTGKSIINSRTVKYITNGYSDGYLFIRDENDNIYVSNIYSLDKAYKCMYDSNIESLDEAKGIYRKYGPNSKYIV